METDLFLQNTKISLSGPIVSGSFKIDESKIYNTRKITPSTESEVSKISNLSVKKNQLGNYESTDTKIFTFDEKFPEATGAFITINKTLDEKTQILKIIPRIVMAGGNSMKATTEQKLTINFSSPFFSFEPRDKILGNQYVSSQDRLSLTQSTEGGTANQHLTIESNNNSGGLQTITYKQDGDKLFKIDIGDFY
jgi:hypothetical protein